MIKHFDESSFYFDASSLTKSANKNHHLSWEREVDPESVFTIFTSFFRGENPIRKKNRGKETIKMKIGS